MKITPELLKNSYTLLFTEQIPEVLFYQRDRPHYYNLLLKLIALAIIMAFLVPLTLLPVYPFLSVMLSNNLSVSKAFSMSSNLHWIALMYIFYIYHVTNTVTTNSPIDTVSGSVFISLFMLLTPVAILMTWYYAMPVTIHNIFIDLYNSVFGMHPMLAGGMPYTSMRCPSDTVTRLSMIGGQTGGGRNWGKGLFGMGFVDLALLALIGVILTLVIAYLWTHRLPDVKLNDKRVAIKIAQ